VRRRPDAAPRDRRGEERVEVREPLLEALKLDAPVDEEVLPELVAAEHLEHQPAEVAKLLLAHLEERPPLPAELPDRRQGAPDGPRRRLRGRRLARGSAADPHPADPIYG
jgi:hypothetical protein